MSNRYLCLPAIKREGFPLIDDPLHPLWLLQGVGWADYSPQGARALAELVAEAQKSRWRRQQRHRLKLQRAERLAMDWDQEPP